MTCFAINKQKKHDLCDKTLKWKCLYGKILNLKCPSGDSYWFVMGQEKARCHIKREGYKWIEGKEWRQKGYGW